MISHLLFRSAHHSWRGVSASWIVPMRLVSAISRPLDRPRYCTRNHCFLLHGSAKSWPFAGHLLHRYRWFINVPRLPGLCHRFVHALRRIRYVHTLILLCTAKLTFILCSAGRGLVLPLSCGLRLPSLCTIHVQCARPWQGRLDPWRIRHRHWSTCVRTKFS